MGNEKAELEALERALGRAREGLETLSPTNRWTGRLLFASAVAQRAFDRHDALPLEARRPYSETWRATLNDIWAYAAGDEAKFYDISQALGRFYLSPQHHNEGQDGPNDADHPEVAATLFAANCSLYGLTEFAVLAAARLLEGIDTDWFGVDETRRIAETRAELRQQEQDVSVIRDADRAPWRGGAPPDLLRRLRP